MGERSFRIFVLSSVAIPFILPMGGWAGGLDLRHLTSPLRSPNSDSVITVVRVDPREYEFRLLCASEHGRKRRTVKEWSHEFGLIGAVNAGMFQKDGLTSTGYLKNFHHVNNPRINATYNSLFVFNPIDPSLPPVQMIDRECEGFGLFPSKYHSVVQNLRMISCTGENVWKPQPRRSSIVSLGVDSQGKILVLFSRSPYSVHEFVNILLSLDLGIQRAMYLEGGPEASLYLKQGDEELSLAGSFEPFFKESGQQEAFWPVPNVIGIVEKRMKSEKGGSRP